MAREQREVLAGKDALDWLQSEMHQAKAQVTRLQQQADQMQALVLDLAEKAQGFEASLREGAGQVALVPELQEGLHQALALIAGLKEQQGDASTQVEELVRQREEETERLREERAEVARRLEDVQRQLETAEIQRGPARRGEAHRHSEHARVEITRPYHVAHVVDDDGIAESSGAFGHFSSPD